MTKRTIGVGVIGLGWMGRLHSRSYRKLQEYYPDLDADIQLVAAADPLESNRDAAVSQLGFERVYSDYKDLLSDPDIDVVSICCPNFLHRDVAVAAAQAGKPFWIEKPMGVSAAQSQEIAAAAQRHDVVTAVGFNYRHTPAIEKARQLIYEGKLGRITNVRCWLIADYASSPTGPLTWRYNREQAGAGVLGDLMSHGADLVHYLCGAITDVTAVTGTFIPKRPIPLKAGVGHEGWEVSDELGPVENEDYVAVLARLNDGVIATIESSRVCVGPRAEYVIEVYGTDGSVRWNFERFNELEVCLGRDSELQGYTRVMANSHFPAFSVFQPSAGTSMGFDDMKVVEAAQFIESVLSGIQYAPSAADACLAAEVVDAAVASAEDGTWHAVAPVTGPLTFDRIDEDTKESHV